MIIDVLGIKYELVKNYKNAFDTDELNNIVTEYFLDFDYIFGDYSYDKLRLKGFNDNTNKNYRDVNKIENLENYINEYCAFDCRYFLIKKVK